MTAKKSSTEKKNGKTPVGVENQPVSNIMWVKRTDLWSNDYNPNSVATPELELLRQSLREDGWSMPLIIRADGEIVDGFHRWSISGEKEFYAITGGLVPVTILPQAKDRAHQIESTVRYNRARGKHVVDPMADVVIELVKLGQTKEQVCKLLGMEDEEFDRLSDRGNMPKRGSKDKFEHGWIPNDGSYMAGEGWEEK
jgi:ParB-like chromosome segregation protein Spo0J